MQKIQITLSSIQDIRKFVNEVTLLDYEVDLEQGRYIVDAKSIMGIFSLDLRMPICMTVNSDSCDHILASIEKYIVANTDK